MAAIRVPDWDLVEKVREVERLARPDILALARVQFEFPTGTRFPCLPVRAGTRGLIYPLKGQSYCSGAELRVAIDIGAVVKVEHGIILPWASTYQPFAEFTANITNIRSKHPKGSVVERATKEIGNSLYGKIAQAVDTMRARPDGGIDGVRGKRVFDTRTALMKSLPPSAITQPALAAYTTGLVRAVLSELLARLPAHRVVYTATTDGFLSDARLAEVDATGPVAQFFAEIRRQVAGNDGIFEVKHRVAQVVTIKTRGTFSRPTESWVDDRAPSRGLTREVV